MQMIEALLIIFLAGQSAKWRLHKQDGFGAMAIFVVSWAIAIAGIIVTYMEA